MPEDLEGDTDFWVNSTRNDMLSCQSYLEILQADTENLAHHEAVEIRLQTSNFSE